MVNIIVLLSIILPIAAILVAVVIHELAHAWAADYLGDPTARINGRLTLNPIPHLDPVGSLLVPTLLILTQSPIIFGWAKPVTIDPYNLDNPKRDQMLIAFAGPAVNLLFATALSLVGKFFIPQLLPFFAPFITINIILAVFNLLPVPPLDGSKVAFGLLPPNIAHEYERATRQMGILLLILILFPFGGRSLAAMIILPIINWILSLLL